MGLCASCCRKKVIDFSTQTSPIIPTPVPSPVLTSRSKYEAVWTPFNEPAFSIYEQSKSIVGFENEKCSTLEQALHPFHGEIESLTEQIERAKAECYPRRANNGNSERISSPAEKSDRITLSHDQSAAIYLYTMREHKSSVYSHLQDALKSGEIVKIQKWFKYLNLLKSALNQLPSSKGKLYQTVVAKKEVHRLKSEMITIYSCLGSASSTADLPTKQFVKEHPGEKMMQVIYDNVDSYDISKFSANTYDEYLIWPGMRWYIYKLETLRSKIIIYITSAMGKSLPRHHRHSHIESFI